MSKIAESYIAIEIEKSEDKDCDDYKYLVCLDKDGIGSVELGYNGIPSEWEDFVQNQKPGYYKITYEYYMDSDWDESTYQSHSYPVIDGDVLPKIEPSFIARIIAWELYIDNVCFNFISLFQKRWCVDIEYGGVGISTTRSYLPKALFQRFIYIDPEWGKGWTKLCLRRK